MKISIIIPVKKINKYVREAIPYFLKQTFQNFEIIIVSESKENENFPKTKIIKVNEMPPSEKRNIGAKKANGDILAFIDDDAYPEKDWLENAIKNFKDKTIVAVGGPGLIPKNSTFFQKVSSKTFELSSKKIGIRYKKNKRKYVDDWPSFNFLVKKSEFEKVNGFESGSWGAEDTLLSYAIINGNKKIISDPEVIVYHHPRKNLTQHLKQILFYGTWRGFLTKRYKRSLKLTFFIPTIFLFWVPIAGLIALFSFKFRILYLCSIILYISYLLIIGFKTKNLKLFFPVIFLTNLSHLTYGIGFLKGILLDQNMNGVIHNY